jgi:hypothetical protein
VAAASAPPTPKPDPAALKAAIEAEALKLAVFLEARVGLSQSAVAKLHAFGVESLDDLQDGHIVNEGTLKEVCGVRAPLRMCDCVIVGEKQKNLMIFSLKLIWGWWV